MWFTEAYGNRIGRITTQPTEGPCLAKTVVSTGNPGRVACPELPTGTVTEFSAGISPDSNPSGIAAGPDGSMWFTEAYGNRIGRITPAGVVTEFPAAISPNSGPWWIAAGPDGNMWYGKIGRIGRITPAGVVTEFSAPAWGVAAGPDGNMWSTDLHGSGVVRITLSLLEG
jgi:streptogramin lyase